MRAHIVATIPAIVDTVLKVLADLRRAEKVAAVTTILGTVAAVFRATVTRCLIAAE
jgi:hypothetical protein